LVRGQVLARLGFLGLTEDAEANARHGRHTRGRISPDGPAVAMVVPTDEELMIARDTARLTAVGARTEPCTCRQPRRTACASSPQPNWPGAPLRADCGSTPRRRVR